jgi:hypothetical protein
MPEGLSGAHSSLEAARKHCTEITTLETAQYDELGGIIDELEDLQAVAEGLVGRLFDVKDKLSNMTASGQSDQGAVALATTVLESVQRQFGNEWLNKQMGLHTFGLRAAAQEAQDQREQTYRDVVPAIDNIAASLQGEVFRDLLALVVACREPSQRTGASATRTGQEIEDFVKKLDNQS